MNKEGKIWGENLLIFKNDVVQINQVYIKKGGRCSKHKHNHKNNIFFIQKGKLFVEQWRANDIVDETILVDRDMLDIDSQIYHRFTALEDTQAIEIYYLNIDIQDIDREDCGSIIDVEKYLR